MTVHVLLLVAMVICMFQLKQSLSSLEYYYLYYQDTHSNE